MIAQPMDRLRCQEQTTAMAAPSPMPDWATVLVVTWARSIVFIVFNQQPDIGAARDRASQSSSFNLPLALLLARDKVYKINPLSDS